MTVTSFGRTMRGSKAGGAGGCGTGAGAAGVWAMTNADGTGPASAMTTRAERSLLCRTPPSWGIRGPAKIGASPAGATTRTRESLLGPPESGLRALAPQPCRAAHAGGGSVPAFADRGREPVGEHVRGDGGRKIAVELVDLRQAAADDDHVGIEDVDDMGHGAPEPVDVAPERRARVAVAGAHRGDDLLRLERPPGFSGVIGCHRRPGQERLDAALPAAVARRAGPLVVARRREGIVAPLAGDAVAA